MIYYMSENIAIFIASYGKIETSIINLMRCKNEYALSNQKVWQQITSNIIN